MNLREEKAELVVVGAGPAGLCAAMEAARAGTGVVVFDENLRAGGQLRKQVHRFFGSRHHGAGKRGFEIADDLESESLNAGAKIRLGATVLGFFSGGKLMVEGPEGVYLVEPRAAVIATGASERCAAFPGWTLPGIMGAGAAQTLVNLHGVLPGRKVLMAGAGNVGMIVTYQLIQAGAEVAGVIEISDRVGGYGVHLDRVKREGVPLFLRHRIMGAEGKGGLEAVVVEDMEKGRARRFRVDALCLALGLSPLAELAAMRGCRMVHNGELGGFLPWHDANMCTDIPGVYVAGDASGVEEASVAMEEGRMCGISASEYLGVLDLRRAAGRKKAVRRRLDALRGGPYGEVRRAAKEKVCGI